MGLWAYLMKRKHASKGGRVASTAVLLQGIIDPHLLQSVLQELPDRRQLVEALAAKLSISEERIWQEVAKKNTYPYVPHLAAIDVSLLPSGLSTDMLRRCGAIVQMEQGVLRGLVTADPSLIPEGNAILRMLPLSLGAWPAIRRALEESERMYIERQSLVSKRREDQRENLALRVLGVLLEEMRRASSHELIFECASPTSVHWLIPGMNKEGTVDPRIAPILLQLLRERMPQLSENSPSLKHLKVVIDGHLLRLVEDTASVQRHATQRIAPAAAQANRGSEEILAAANKGAANILLVDDNGTFARVLARFFNRSGHVTHYAENGKKALELVRSGMLPIDLIVCDVHMPSMNGFDLIHELRKDARHYALPVVMLTSDEDVECHIKLLSQGADAYVTKNQDPRLLCVQVQRLLDRAKREAA